MRGKHCSRHLCRLQIRITPADAGKTGVSTIDITPSTDHPRGCGENSMGSKTFRGYIGSPPRMRGKPGHTYTATSYGRITPADAGKTLSLHVVSRGVQDHPRGCGENEVTFPFASYVIGSPPRMRGKLNETVEFWYKSGITPADAGKTNME